MSRNPSPISEALAVTSKLSSKKCLIQDTHPTSSIQLRQLKKKLGSSGLLRTLLSESQCPRAARLTTFLGVRAKNWLSSPTRTQQSSLSSYREPAGSLPKTLTGQLVEKEPDALLHGSLALLGNDLALYITLFCKI